jgi:hypothetical protein
MLLLNLTPLVAVNDVLLRRLWRASPVRAESTSVQVADLGAWLAVVRHDRAPCLSASLTLPLHTQ